jgi:hypothetical protein
MARRRRRRGMAVSNSSPALTCFLLIIAARSHPCASSIHPSLSALFTTQQSAQVAARSSFFYMYTYVVQGGRPSDKHDPSLERDRLLHPIPWSAYVQSFPWNGAGRRSVPHWIRHTTPNGARLDPALAGRGERISYPRSLRVVRMVSRTHTKTGT